MVAMIRVPSVTLLCIFILASCDPGYGPSFRNEFPEEVGVTVSFGDGTEWSGVWPPCREVFLGQENKSIERIIMEVSGEIIHDFRKDKIDKFNERESGESGYSVWIVDRSGIRFSTEDKCSVKEKS